MHAHRQPVQGIDYLYPVLRPSGRLGNILFEIAAVFAYALRSGTLMKVPWQTNPHSLRLRDFLGAPFDTTTISYQDSAYVAHTIKEFNYVPIPDGITSGGILGYCQSEKYFKEFENEVRELYAPFIKPRRQGTVGVHIRLGDYITLADKWHTASPEFIRKAVLQLPDNTHTLVLFSDEPKKATRILSRALGVDILSRYKLETDLTSDPCCCLSNMTAMQNMIMSASSFSWWGAWLGKADQVFAPEKWFVAGNDDCSDVCPESWIRL